MSKNKSRKMNLILGISIVILFSAIFTFTLNFRNLVLINKLFANADEVANEAFEDKNFYKVVVDEYNQETGSNVDYTDNLSDAQLAQITKIKNDEPLPENKITSLKGIEKLTGITELKMQGNNISSVDLSKNTNLRTMNLSYNNLTEIDLSNNINLRTAELAYNNLQSVDLRFKQENDNFNNLDLNNNNLNTTDNILGFSDLSKLQTLRLNSNNLSTINLSYFSTLFILDANNNNLNTTDNIIGFNNLNLMALSLGRTNLSEIDLSHMSNMSILRLYDNHINTIDLSNLHNLSDFRDLDQLFYYQKGKEYPNINIILTNGNSVTNYEVSDNSILSIENGKIKALSLGFANIYGVYSNQLSNQQRFHAASIYVYEISSNRYNINHDLNFIDVASDTDEEIYDNVNVDGVDARKVIEDNVLKIYSNDGLNNLITEYDLVRYNSNKYDLNNGYVFDSDNSLSEDDIICINCNVVSENDSIKIMHNDILIKDLPIVSYRSSKYDLSKGYVYVGINEFDDNDIITTNCDKSIDDNDNLIIKHNGNTLISMPIISVSSDVYDLSKDIVVADDNFNPDYINVINGDKEYDNGKLYIKLNGNIVKEFLVRKKGSIKDDTKTTTSSSRTTLSKFDKNAKTYDDIVRYFIIGGISIVLVIGIIIYTKKKK